MHHSWLNNPNLLALTGSKLYGVATPTSDDDWRGFVIPPVPFLLGTEIFDQFEHPKEDIVIYSLQKFIKLLCTGNTQAIETLFSTSFKFKDEIAEDLINKRSLFISKRYYRSIRGFSTAEFRKAKAVRLVIESGSKDHDEMIHQLCGAFNLKRFQRDQIIDLIEEFTGKPIKREISSVPQLGERRKEDVQRTGYSPKNLYHTIRLLSQGIELMSHGCITYPRPEAELLKSIRNETIGFAEAEKIYEKLDKEFTEAYNNSRLPDQPAIKEINDWYINTIKNYNF